MFEQGIEVVDQWLHFVRKCPFDSDFRTISQTQELSAETVEGAESSAKLPRSYRDTHGGEHQSNTTSRVVHVARLPMDGEKPEMHRWNQAEGPESGAKENAPAKGMRQVHG